MDRQTVDLLDALRHPGASFLLSLLDGPATEAELITDARAIRSFDQSTGNRRLRQLERVGLTRRAGGGWRTPGREWTMVAPVATRGILDAALKLSADVARREKRERSRAQRRIVPPKGSD